jgi:3-phosphoshikimate 1-carboxyvinyltransferase
MFRTVTALACLADGYTIIEGNKAMKNRPVLQFLSFVNDLGAEFENVSDPGALRIRLRGAKSFGGRTTVDASQSSQFLSSLLMVAPLADRPVEIGLLHTHPVGESYIELTLDLMAKRNVAVRRDGFRYRIPQQAYEPVQMMIPSDLTALSYLSSCALVAREAEITVDNYILSEMNSENIFLNIARQLGLSLEYSTDKKELIISRAWPSEFDIDIDGRNIPTVITLLAGSAPFVEGSVTVKGAGHINNHKCQRLSVVIDQLRRMGCVIEPIFTPEGAVDGFATYGRQTPPGARELESFMDHRVFAGLYIASLGARAPTHIRGAEYLDDGYPNFLETVERLAFPRERCRCNAESLVKDDLAIEY